MYIPNHYRITDEDEIRELIRENPFATLVSQIGGEPFATHLPMLLDPTDDQVLLGHVAVQNPHKRAIGDDQFSLAIFSGPHAYVSPHHYVTGPSVPTWNYATVHVYGRLEPISDEAEMLRCLRLLVETFDPLLHGAQPESTSDAFWIKQLPGIAAFAFRIERIEAKAKASQNRKDADRDSVIAAFAGSEDAEERRVAELMARQIEPDLAE